MKNKLKKQNERDKTLKFDVWTIVLCIIFINVIRSCTKRKRDEYLCRFLVHKNNGHLLHHVLLLKINSTY